jgi:hypothetical protein
VKAAHGLTTRIAPNRLNARKRKHPCPPEKRSVIERALRHFGDELEAMGAAMGTVARGKHYNFRISQLSESTPDKGSPTATNSAFALFGRAGTLFGSSRAAVASFLQKKVCQSPIDQMRPTTFAPRHLEPVASSTLYGLRFWSHDLCRTAAEVKSKSPIKSTPGQRFRGQRSQVHQGSNNGFYPFLIAPKVAIRGV